jgi:hypothetical protein
MPNDNTDILGGLLGIGAALLGIVVAVIAVVWAIRYQRHQISQNTEWANARGWFYTRSDRALARRWQRPPFDNRSGTASDIFTGPYRGYRCGAFTFSYTESSGKSSYTVYWAIYTVYLAWRLPRLDLKPEAGGEWIERLFGQQDIQFESADFNAAWDVRCDDIRFAYGVVHPQLIEYLMAPGRASFNFRIEGADALSYHRNRLSRDEIFSTLDRIIDIVCQIPRHVWDDYARADLGQ